MNFFVLKVGKKYLEMSKIAHLTQSEKSGNPQSFNEMNILFVFSDKNSINPQKPLEVQIHVQLGISYIASLLKSHGHKVDLLVLCKKTGQSFINNYIENFNPQLICFTAVFSEYDFIAHIAKYVKQKYPNIYLLAGGTHVTLNPEETIQDDFQAICVGEGEFPILELVKQLEVGENPSQIKNLWIKSRNGIEKKPTRDFIAGLDGLPFPERDMWQKWIQYPISMHTILIGRGCPFQCTYCCNHALRKISGGEYVRYRSPDSILAEIEELVSKYPQPDTIYFEIETIGVNTKFAFEFFPRLEQFNAKRSQPLSFGINLRITPGVDYNPLFLAMQKANFSFVNIGLESGSERVRKEILRRNYSNNDYLQAVNIAKNHGLKVNTYVLVGIPGETLEDFKETIKTVRQSQPNEPFYSICFPYPGTILYQHCKDKGLLPPQIDTQSERLKATLDLPGFSRRQIQRQFDWFYYNVYKGHKPIKVIWEKTKEKKLPASYLFNIIDKICPF